MGYFACAQGLENFSNLTTTSSSSYLSRTWIGTDGVTWNATSARTDQTINSNAICTNNSGTVSSPIYHGGMGTLSFSYVRAFTGTSSRSIEVWVNGTQVGSTITVSPTSNSIISYNQLINVSGNVSLEIRTSGAQIKIDDISWTTYTACIAPADPTGNIIATASCGSTQLDYSLPSTSAYWQTSDTGTNTAFPTTTSFVASLSGTYYVRIFNGTCWSSGVVSQMISVSNPVSITTQPISQSTTTGATATFDVLANNVSSYQWQISTNSGSSWSNIGTNTNSFTTSASTLSMNGYQYRVVISGNSPCSSVTSSVANLTVSSGPCLNQANFTSTPPGWSETNISYASNEASFASHTGELTTVAVSYPTSLTFDLRRTGNSSLKTMYVEVSTTTQGGTYTTVAAYDHSNTTSGSTTMCTVNLSAYTSFASVYIRFRKQSSTTSPWYFQNINVFCGTPPSGPEINVTGNGLSIVDGDTSPTVSDNTNFGSTTLGTDIIKTFVIENNGTTDLTLSLPLVLTDTSLPQEFIITQPSISIVTPGNSTFFTVRFNSAVSGLFTNTINIANDDTNESLYNFDILAIASSSLTGGTSFRSGELIFVGYDGQVNGSGADDEYLVATLVDVLPGTIFSIVNARYEAGANAGVRTNKWGGGGDDPSEAPYEATITYNGISTIPAGSIFQIRTNGSSNWFGSVSVISGTTSSVRTSEFSGNIVGGILNSPNISTSSPDQIYLVQGSFVSDGTINLNEANYYLSGNLLHGLTNRAAWVPLANACSGSSSSSSSNPRESRLPSSLTCFNVESISGSAESAYYENDKQHGIASLNQIINAVADVTNNWTLSTGRYVLDPTSNSVTRAGKTFQIGASNPSGQWVGGIDTNWFNCANWEGLSVPDSGTDVIINSSAINVAEINYNSNYSDEYNDLAMANNLNILGSRLEILGDSNNRLEVFGDLLIDNVGVLDMDDSNSATLDGQIFLRGNWSNNVNETSFEEGNSTVIFKGTATQIISAVAPEGTEVFGNVILDNDFTTATSNNIISKGNLTVNPTRNLVVSSNDYVQIDNDLIVDGTLNILNNGSLIQVNDSGVNTGNISFERATSMRRLDYVYWSSPVTGFNIDNISSNTPSNLIFSWNPTIVNSNGGIGNWIGATGSAMNNGKGYIVRGPNNFNNSFQTYTATFNNGIPHNGIVVVPISRGTYTGADYSGVNGVTITRFNDNLNLIGNPYPSSISALDFLNLNTNIEGAVRLWTHGTLPSTSISDPFYGDFNSNYTINDYIVHNGIGTTSGPAGFNGLIAGAQGFFVIMNDGTTTTESVTFNNSLRSRTYDNSQFFKTTPFDKNQNGIEKHRIWLDLIDVNNESVRTLIGYKSDATYAKDRMYDAIGIQATTANIYSLINEEKMCIQGRPLPFNTEDRVPLGVKIASAGINSIAIHTVDGLFENQDIFVEDLYLNITHDLKLSPYTFSASVGVFDDRFVLKYKGSALSNDDFTNDEDQLVVVSNENIEINSVLENIEAVTVYDVLGRKLYEKKNINNQTIYINNLMKNNTALIVQVKLMNDKTVSKKILY
jgi:hypothetical protein